MGTKIFVGNLSFNTNEADLSAHFEQAGFTADKVTIVNDRETGRSRGFGFIEMDDDAAADKAIQALDGSQMGGRDLRVNEARERGSGPPRR